MKLDIQAYIESGVIESYILGLATEQEVAELEQLRKQYPEINQALAAFEASLEAQAMANAKQPPAHIKQRLFKTLHEEFDDVAITATQPQAATTSGKVVSLFWNKYAAAAAVLLIVASAGLNIYFFNKVEKLQSQYLALVNERNSLEAGLNIYKTKALDIYNSMQLMSDPNMLKVSMPGIKGKENNLATVFWDKQSKEVYLLPNRLPQAPENKQYQLWALVNGKPVDAGLLSADCNGLCKLKNVPDAQAFAITLENKGGSPAPHLDQLYVFGKISG
ncbi:MAG: anti-sigma factor [Sphingobacteriales bacterium]|uniref:anti-sigma factor n=1 Tax=Hydrotalea flava TaxID=714549 RepID=UPI000836A293|nr:anti-sigma factor [Hydrotalea flava]RTL55656.1 MAG: anti-sigma factor [Sphingobacteriales bacterium]